MTDFGVEPTSYFSRPENTLDPKLFEGRLLRPWVRQGITTLLMDFLNLHYRHPELWAQPWLAGSGVSYQWSAAREPGDLDCLVGVNFVQFRKANPEFAGLMDKEIAAELNEAFRENLQLQTSNWNGYELTFYVNPTATDIRAIKPYAAYDLKHDEWTVTPDPNVHPVEHPEWEQIVMSDADTAAKFHTQFTAALQDIQGARNTPMQRNAENRLTLIAASANTLYNTIHENRSLAFSQAGEGYNDFHNYRWQAGKRYGTVQKLRGIREYMRRNMSTTFDVELPDASTMIRRAATYRNN